MSDYYDDGEDKEDFVPHPQPYSDSSQTQSGPPRAYFSDSNRDGGYGDSNSMTWAALCKYCMDCSKENCKDICGCFSAILCYLPKKGCHKWDDYWMKSNAEENKQKLRELKQEQKNREEELRMELQKKGNNFDDEDVMELLDDIEIAKDEIKDLNQDIRSGKTFDKNKGRATRRVKFIRTIANHGMSQLPNVNPQEMERAGQAFKYIGDHNTNIGKAIGEVNTDIQPLNTSFNGPNAKPQSEWRKNYIENLKKSLTVNTSPANGSIQSPHNNVSNGQSSSQHSYQPNGSLHQSQLQMSSMSQSMNGNGSTNGK